MSTSPIKGRGAQVQSNNRFCSTHHQPLAEFDEYRFRESEDLNPPRTVFTETFPKTIVNKVNSPDVGMDFSLNPYQGCEHGCIYCYARNSHEFWGYGAGLDFEQKILVKKNAVALLEKKFQSKSWKPAPIVLSGNTDCYQPIERKLEITRGLLQLFLKYKHPVGIITKNSLILRDLDILVPLARLQLVKVMISVTTLDEAMRQILEPRTASIKKRLQTIEALTNAGVPTGVMIAPVIPGINSHEILPLVKAVSEKGALHLGHTIVRLNGAIGVIFEDWVKKVLPERADKIMNQIAACHNGQINDSVFGRRMKGHGPVADQINSQFAIAKNKYMRGRTLPELRTDLFIATKGGQLTIF